MTTSIKNKKSSKEEEEYYYRMEEYCDIKDKLEKVNNKISYCKKTGDKKKVEKWKKKYIEYLDKFISESKKELIKRINEGKKCPFSPIDFQLSQFAFIIENELINNINKDTIEEIRKFLLDIVHSKKSETEFKNNKSKIFLEIYKFIYFYINKSDTNKKNIIDEHLKLICSS
jgi:hypothetical protein